MKANFIEVLRWRAIHQANQRAYTFLVDGETELVHLTYGELDKQARAIAAQLQRLDAIGERALLLYPAGLEFIAAFFGCLYAGVVAVPAYPPRNRRHIARIEAILADTEARVALTISQLAPKVKAWLSQTTAQQLHLLLSDRLSSDIADEWHKPQVANDTLAFLQYTSGSTGTPKGVMVSHGNLLHNEHLIERAFQHTEQTIVVGWLPPYHDMGLVGNLLQPMYLGIPCILMSAIAFLQKPVRWLQAITRFRATTSGGPNFAYELCIQKIPPEQRQTLDLSSWQVAFNGSEPVRAETLERFAATFAPCGFRPQAFLPCYGLAEATLLVSASRNMALPMMQTVAADALEQNRVVVAQPTQGNTRTLVSCGQSMLEQQIAIANPETLTLCPPDQIGEIWVLGSSVAQGYWKRPEATALTFQAYLADTRTGPFLRTGDLGFIRDGELFITGRLKDLIVIRGRNYYPQDIEQTAAQTHPALIVGSNAVFGVEVKDEERLVIVQEVQRTALKTLNVEAVAMAIRQAVTGKYEVPVYAVVLLKPGTIPKTSSGKNQRFACRQKFLDGSLDVVGSQILEPSDSELPKVQQPLRWWRITRHTILALSPSERLPFLESYLKEQVARVLQVSVSQIDQQLPLSHLGLDSLMLLGLRLQIEQELDTPLPNNFLDEDVSLSQLTAQLLNSLITNILEGGINSALNLSPSSVQGDVPLTPIQHRFLEREQLDFNYDQTILLYLRSPKHADPAIVEQVLQHILTYHDALRLRFIKESDRWRQFYAEAVETVAFQHIDASELPRSEWKFLIEQTLEDLNRGLNLSTGPLLGAALVDFGSQHPGALLLVMHHLVSDAISCKVIISDIRRFYEQLSRGESIVPLPKTTSYKDWAEKLTTYAQTEAVRQELPFWLSLSKLKFPITRYQLPVDFPGGINSRASIARVEKVVLSPLETHDFQQKFPADPLESALLTALTQAFCNWTSQSFLYVELDRHGREHSFEDINLSRTVGFFLCHFPIRLELGTANTPSSTPVWQQIHDQIQRVPNNGISYGLLRYLNQDADVAELMRRIPQPQVHFTYQSNRFDPPQSVASFPLILSEVRSNSLNIRDYLLTVRVSQMRGSLHCSFGYSTELHRKSSIEALASHFTQALRSLLTGLDS